MDIFQEAMRPVDRLDIVRKDCVAKIINILIDRYGVKAEVAQDQADMIFDECFAICFEEHK